MDAPGFRRIIPERALALACGALLALSFPRPAFWPLAWVCLAPLLILWTNLRPRQAFASGLLAGFAIHGVGFYWIFNTCRFAGLPAPLGVLAWAAMAFILALNWALIAAAGSWLVGQSAQALQPWLWALLWNAFAFAWGRWTPRLNADLLAYTQYRNLPFIQMDSVFGPEGLGFVIVAFNAALGLALVRGRQYLSRAASANCAAMVLLVLLSWNWGKIQIARAPEDQEPFAAVEMLQPNVDQYHKWDRAFVSEIQSNLQGILSLPRRQDPALIVWPESALPHFVNEGQSPSEAVPWSRRLNAYQIVGAVTLGASGEYNSAVLIRPDGNFGGVYHKRVLVPFGEFVPLPFLRRWIGILDQLGNLTAGSSRQALFQTPLGLIGVAICYEMTFPRLTRADAARGARVIVNITNDGWYKDTWGPYQHFMASSFRAVENRVYVIRAANTGISGVVDPWGRVVASLPLGVRGRLDANIPTADPFPNRSFYARHGDWFGALCLVLSLIWVAWTLAQARAQ